MLSIVITQEHMRVLLNGTVHSTGDDMDHCFGAQKSNQERQAQELGSGLGLSSGCMERLQQTSRTLKNSKHLWAIKRI